MVAIDWLQVGRDTVPGKLTADCRRQVRDVPYFAFVACSVGLHAGEIVFIETSRFRAFAEKKLVGAVHVFDSRRQVVTFDESKRGFEQIAVADISAINVLVSSPQQ